MSKGKNSEKPFEIFFEHRLQYLYVYVSGRHNSYEILRQYWLEFAAECSKTEYKKVLIDEDIEESSSVTEVFQLAAKLTQMGFQGVRVAFYDRHSEHQDLNQFGELVATNRGLIGRVFNDFEAAENWLLDRNDLNPDSSELSENSYLNR